MRLKIPFAVLAWLALSNVSLARQVTENIFDGERMAASSVTKTLNVEAITTYDITASVTESQPANQTAISGTAEVQTATFEALADTDAGDWLLISDKSGGSWGYSSDTTGTDDEPTDPLWTAISAARKVHCDLSGATTEIDVAAAAELCIDALTGFTAVIVTSDVAADGTMTFTQVESGPTVNLNPQNATGAGAGGIGVAETTPGVLGKVSVSGNTINLGAHAYITGLKGRFTTTGGVPTGLSTGTDYWLIKTDDDNVKVASSAANALAGTAIDITAIGSGTQTFVVDTDLEADIKLQKNNSARDEEAVWIDIGSSLQAVDAGGNFGWSGTTYARELRVVYIGDSSEATVTAWLSGKD